MDTVKEIFDAASQRIRSPFLGSILLAFVLWNWKPLWLLMFAEGPVADRIACFEAQTPFWASYAVPVGLGIAAALVLPWVRFLGAWVAKVPNAYLKRLQDDEARARRIARIEASEKEEQAKSDLRVAQIKMTLQEEEARIALESAKEQATIDASKRLAEAQAVSPDAEEELKRARESHNEVNEIRMKLPATEQVSGLRFGPEILQFASRANAGQVEHSNGKLHLWLENEKKVGIAPTKHRDALDLSHTLNRLVELDVLRSISSGTYEITSLGYDVLDALTKA